MKLKIGDKFKVVNEIVGKNWNIDGEMDKWFGKIMTVRNIKDDYGDYYEAEEDVNENIDEYEDTCGWGWYDNMIDWEETGKLNK